MSNSTRTKALRLANQITKYNLGLTKSQAMIIGWRLAKNNTDLHLLDGHTKSGKPLRRVVLISWNDYNTVKGTGKPVGDERLLLVDAAKYYGLAKNHTISVYRSNITRLAA